MKNQSNKWWGDLHAATFTPSNRFSKRREHVLAKLAALQDRPDFKTISDVVHQLLNLELENILDKLHVVLRGRGVFVGTQFPRLRRGQTNPGRDGAAPGSTKG